MQGMCIASRLTLGATPRMVVRMKLPPVRDRSVLVTGCSSGIGRATAVLLRRRGWRVLTTARQDEDLARLRDEGFEALHLDVADAASVRAAAEEALRVLGPTPGGLVNNAGFGQAGAMEDISRDALRYQFEVNVFGLQDLTNRLLPAMVRAGAGRIVHVSSVLGRASIPMNGCYCATKHAVEAIADAQRVELRGTGVGISLVEPGPIRTAFRRNAARQAQATLDTAHSRFGGAYDRQIDGHLRERPEDIFAQPPEAVARAIAHALESTHPRARYRVTLVAQVVPLLRALTPDGLYDRVAARRLRH